MSFADLDGVIWFPDPLWLNSSEQSSKFYMNAAGEYIYHICTIPKSGTITGFRFRIRTVSTSDSIDVGIETVSGGTPTGTNYGGSAPGTQASVSSSTSYLVTLATPATATAGDKVALTMRWTSYNSGNIIVSMFGPMGGTLGYQGTAHSADSGGYCAAWGLEYDDGSYANINTWPATRNFSSDDFNTGTDPDEFALKFQLPFACKVTWGWGYFGVDAGADFDAIIYDSDGSTALSTTSVDADDVKQAFARDFFKLADEVELDANTEYYYAIKPTTGNDLAMAHHEFASNAVLDSICAGSSCYQSARTDGGSWTDTTNYLPVLGIGITSVEEGGGGGGSYAFT